MVEHSSKILACKDKASTTTKPPLIWDQLGLSLVELATCEIYILTRTVHKTHFDPTFDPFFLKNKKKTTKKNQLCENVTSVSIPPPPPQHPSIRRIKRCCSLLKALLHPLAKSHQRLTLVTFIKLTLY